MSLKRSFYVAWSLLIVAFAAVYLVHLRADFPNNSPWMSDWAKYTDEGWYGNAAIHEHLLGHWRVRGDFTPAPAAPVWPFLEWVLFSFTGVGIEPARALVVSVFFVNLTLAYILLRKQGPRWMALLALSAIVTCPFVYSFSRLATLEPLLTALTLAAILIAVQLPRMRYPVWGSMGIGLLCTMLLLTKPTAVFIFPAIMLASLQPLWAQRKLALRCALAAISAFAITTGAWMMLLVQNGLFPEYRYLIELNKYEKIGSWWLLTSAIKTCYFALDVDPILLPVGILFALLALVAWRRTWARELWRNAVFSSSMLVVLGLIIFVIFQNLAPPRYYAVLTFFLILTLVEGIDCLMRQKGRLQLIGKVLLAFVAIAIAVNGYRTINYAHHPQYTFVNAAIDLTRYVDDHANGNRILVSSSGDSISLITRLPALSDPNGTEEFGAKLADYQPGWIATWNSVSPFELQAIHRNFTLEQVASYPAFDDPDRNLLVLFKLHPLSAAQRSLFAARESSLPYPEDRIEVPVLDPGKKNQERMRQKLVRELRQHLPRIFH